MATPITSWQDALLTLGLSAPVTGVLVWLAPKLATAARAWWATRTGNTDLAATIQGAQKDIVLQLREQLAAAEQRMKELDAAMAEMRVTMNKLLDENAAALRAKAASDNDLFLQGLRVKRLEQQVSSLGQTPVP